VARAKTRSGENTSKAKGDIAEAIAAWLHDWPGVKVERNVRLPAQSDPSRKREIDVLLTTSVAGYSVRFAIECKNESTPIGSPKIDAFVGKLQDVGIPTQQGIFISASGFTKGAAKRARNAEIRALLLRGLSIDGLKASISVAAHQSVVFFLVQTRSVTFFTSSREESLPFFLDGAGRLCGTVPHLIASKWQAGGIPMTPGSYEVTIPVPPDWRVSDSFGRAAEMLKYEVYVELQVLALAMNVVGNAEEYSLVDPASNLPQKLGVRAYFDTPEERFPLAIFDDAASLDRFLSSRQGLRITQRIKVPRIRYHSAYWPISRRAADQLHAFAQAPKFIDGELVFPSVLDVEGLDIAAAWEEPMSLTELDDVFLSRLRNRPRPGTQP
jgi:hypothetical protein